MNERTSDGIMDSTEESILRTCAGLSITDGGISIQNSELPQTVTQTGDPENDVSDNASSESETAVKVSGNMEKLPPVVYLNFVDKGAWSKGKIATITEKIANSYSQFKVSIVTEKPAEGEFYTICIGTTDALKEYAASQGIVFDPEKPDVKSGTAFAEVKRDLSQNLGDLFYDPNIIVSIGDQLSALLADDCPGIREYCPVTVFSEPSSQIVYLSFVDGEMWSEYKISRTIELLQTRCKEKGVSITFVTEKPESGKYSTVYVGSASVLKAYGADEDLSKQDYSDGVAYADTDMGRFGDKEYILSQEYSAIAEQIKQLTEVDLTRSERNLSVDRLLKDEAVPPVVFLSFVDESMWSEGKQAQAIELLQTRCKEKGVSITFVTEKPESGKYSTVYVGSASVLKAYGADEDLSKQDYSDGVAYADTDMGRFGDKEYILSQEYSAIAEQIKQLTEVDLTRSERNLSVDRLLKDEPFVETRNDAIVYGYPSVSSNYVFNLNYFGYIQNNDYFIDAEKGINDDSLCWAAAAANTLNYTGWLTSNTKSEDDVFFLFRNGFQQNGGSFPDYGYEWYLKGTYSAPLYADQPISSAGFFSNSTLNDNYFLYEDITPYDSGFFPYVINQLQNGAGVTLGFNYFDSSMNPCGGHAITLWGYTCDSNETPGTSNYYTGIIVTDSDDDKGLSDPTLAPNILKIWDIKWDASCGYYYILPQYYSFDNFGVVAKLNYYSLVAPASFTTLSSGGAVVSSAATLLSKTVGTGYTMNVSSAGLAMDTTVTSGGVMNVFSGGAALFSSGGSACNIHASSGAILGLTVAPDTYVSGTYGGSAFVISSSTISGYTVHSGCKLDVLSGGTATNITASGGAILGFTVAPNTSAQGSYNGSAFNMTSATISNFDVRSSWRLDVLSGGKATGITAENGARLGITVAPNTSAQGTYNNSPFVMSSAGISNYTVHSDCCLDVLSGGSASNTFVLAGGKLNVSSGGTATSTTVSSGGTQTVFANARSLNTIVSSGGTMNVSSGGAASATTVSAGGIANVLGGAATSTMVSAGGTANIFSGGTADLTTVSHGSANVLSGGLATSTTVRYGGVAVVYSGGTANQTTVSGNGIAVVYSGGIVNATTVSSGGVLGFAGGTALGLTAISPGGVMIVAGPMTIASGASVSAAIGAFVDFDISNLVPANTAMVNDLSLIHGTPTYALTVSGSQSNRAYTLAGGAGGFTNQTIAVINTSGSLLGTLSLNQTAALSGETYTLKKYGDNLGVLVGSAFLPEEIPEFFNGKFAGGSSAIFAKQVTSSSSVNFYAGGSSWGAPLSFDPGWEALGAGDFNGDGRDDILRINDEGLLVAELSNGNGTFSPQVLNLKGVGWSVVGVGDFNGNRKDDVLLASPTAASDTIGLIGYWESGTTWTLIDGYDPEWEVIATGDFNGDGKCDTLWRSAFIGEGGLSYNAYNRWLADPQPGTNRWDTIGVANPDEWTFLCAGDFDGDGTDDIAMIGETGVVKIWNVLNGSLNTDSVLSAVTSDWEFAGVGDFNGDHTDDIAWRNTDTGLTGYWQINNKQLTAWANIATIA